MTSNECPVCEKPTLVAQLYSDMFVAQGGHVYVNGLERFRCTSCDETCMVPDQIHRNHTRISAQRAHVHQNYLLAMAMTAGPRTI